jgi:hypothetical protein
MSVKIGKPNYGGNRVKRKYFRLKDGEATFRILPPLGDLADKGIWSVFYNVHFGYRNSKNQLRPFQSPLVKNRKTKMIEVPDAALERIQKLKTDLENAKATGNTKVVETLEKLVGMKGIYSLDNNHYMNVIDLQGNIGVLQIRHRAKLALDAEIKRLRESGVDPLSADDGRFFTFRRTGMGLDTSFQVTIAKEKLTVQGVGVVERDLVHKLDDETIARLGTEAAQLDSLFKRPTSEDVARIVKESAIATGQSRAVDEILDAPSKVEETQDYEELGTEEETSNVASSSPMSVKGVASLVDTVTVTAPVSTSAPAQQTTAQQIANMSEDEILKSLGLA